MTLDKFRNKGFEDSKLGLKSCSELMTRLLDSQIRKKRISPVIEYEQEIDSYLKQRRFRVEISRHPIVILKLTPLVVVRGLSSKFVREFNNFLVLRFQKFFGTVHQPVRVRVSLDESAHYRVIKGQIHLDCNLQRVVRSNNKL